ncbi:MAG TPA: hypothetical protein PL143_17920 [Rhodocyclaceae bacterium]|nr:hypothetical protein [Rhodocyclaceae bacterium]
MNRREFIRRTGGGAILAMPLASVAPAALAALHARSDAEAAPLVLVAPADLPTATALAQRLAAALRAAGLPATLQHPDGNALRRHDGLSALFAQPAGTRLLGIMDDAAAVIVQAVAGSRGARMLAHGEHRGAAGTIRHCCSATTHDAAIRWREAAHGPQPHLERFYLAALGVGLPAGGPPTAAAAGVPPGSLASFLLQL